MKQPNAVVDGPFGSNLKISDYVDEGIPVLQGKNITNNRFVWKDIRYISEAKAKELGRSAAREGDFLIIKIGSIGYCAQIDSLQGYPYAIIPANLAKVTYDDHKIDSRFLAHWLWHPRAKDYFVSVASTTAQPALSLGKIKGLPIPLPPIPEQRRIAAILDQVDELRRKRRATLDQLSKLSQAIFTEMFGDWRFSLNEWPLVPLGSKLDFMTSGSRGWAEFYSDSGARFLRIQNVKNDELDLSDIAFVNAPSSAEAKRTRLHGGDVLLSITADLGRTAAVPHDIGEAYINQHLAILRAPSLIPQFLSAAIASPAGRADILKKNREGVKAGLNFDDVRSVMIPDVPLSEQRRFASRRVEAERLKLSYREHLSKLDALFASLQHRAFAGELTAKEAERKLELAS